MFSKGLKVDAVLEANVASIRSFLAAVQFYSKFIPYLSIMTEPLTRFTRKGTSWVRTTEEQASFQKLKDALCRDTVLSHYDPNQEISISFDVSNIGCVVSSSSRR